MATRPWLPTLGIALAWGVWLLAVPFGSPLGLIGVALAGAAAAYALLSIRRRMPQGVDTAFRAIAYGLGVLGLGELLLMLQVLSGSSLLVRGLSDKEIARELGVEPKTVSHWMLSLRQKRGAKNRAPAILMYWGTMPGVAGRLWV